MPRFSFNLRWVDGPGKLAVDPELADLPAARAHARYAARDLATHTRMDSVCDWFTCSFEIEDEALQPLLTVPFSDIVPD